MKSQQDVLKISIDISENEIRNKMPNILGILLIDRTKSTKKNIKNIIWANDNYIKYGVDNFSPNSEINSEIITNYFGNIIKPRALKSDEIRKERTKEKAEVFTPTWIVKKQNDEIDKMYYNDDLETYVSRTWLEITCGEAPYMVTRYEMETGEYIDINNRVGFVDRKLIRICNEIDEFDIWFRYVLRAYKSSYGFEWSGDSLLLARENLLYTFIDFYKYKWKNDPSITEIEKIAIIISYNLFQMDGLSYTIPLSEVTEKVKQVQLSLFGDEEDIETKLLKKPGIKVKIMNWKTNKMEFFEEGVYSDE